MRALSLLAVLALAAAGCISTPEETPDEPTTGGPATVALGGGVVLQSTGLKAGLSRLHVDQGGPVKLTFPEGVLVHSEEGRLLPATEAIEVPAGGDVHYLPPYGLTNLTVTVETPEGPQTTDLALAEGSPLVSGDLAVELLKVQRDQFPHRSPGQPSYEASIAYFEAFFKGLGYEVEVLRYAGGNVGPLNLGPDSLSSVVAYKAGSSDRILAFGGHFDVVEQTRDGAFDNTAGTVATMAMAQAFQNVTTEHTLVFGLWGGEEDGILGSQAWLAHHPDLVPLIDAYVNFDVTAIAWPAPKPEPAPIIVAAGPDGPVAQALHAHASTIETTWMQTEAEWVHEGVAQGQATGAGVNAQSDHTPFMGRGVPVFFQFTAKVNDVFAIIHSDVDTVDNLTKYALLGVEGVSDDTVLTPEEVREGEWYLARSFETQMYLGLYYALLTDAGVFPAASAGGGLPITPPGVVGRVN